MAHKLLKQYDEKAIIHALKSSKSYSVNSLFAPWLVPIIKEEQEQK
jgi:hypothetical protein